MCCTTHPGPCQQVPPGGTSFQFRDPTEARHAVYNALTSPDNPRPLNKSHYALAIGAQAYCMGGAGIYTAPTMAGPWSYQGSLYNQMIPEPQVSCAATCVAVIAAGSTCLVNSAHGVL